MKKDFMIRFNFITNVLLLLVLFIGGFTWADTNGVWTLASDVRAGTFGTDEGNGNYTFPNNLDVKNNLNVSNNICLNGQCHNDWSKICQQWVLNNSIN